MNRHGALLALALFLAAMGAQESVILVHGQAQAATREVKRRVAPEYPEIAKRMNLTGKVKLEVVIAPDGHVKTVRTVGGHPVLLQAAQTAVRDWKFAPGASDTTQVVEMEFAGTEVR